jgi:hypothetical protein
VARTRLSPPRPRVPPQTGPARALRAVAALAANATLLTGLLYYFGSLTTQVFFGYFRVHYTLLGQTTPEILARGVDGAAAPARRDRRRGVPRARPAPLPALPVVPAGVATPVAAVLGLALLAVTIAIALHPVPYRRFTALPGLGFALGVVLPVFAWPRWPPAGDDVADAVEWFVAYALVTFGLFWAVGDYAGQVGVRRAFETAQQIPARPALVLVSAQRLNLPGEVHCPAPDGSFQYRYPGLKVLLQSGGQHVLVPEAWDRAEDSTYLVPRTTMMWLEFGPPGTLVLVAVGTYELIRKRRGRQSGTRWPPPTPTR